MYTSQIESVETYVQQIQQYPLLTAERETELRADLESNDTIRRMKAVDELIVSNLRLVVKVAHDFRSCGLPFPDLVSEGNIGLHTAAVRYDGSKGVRFGCYASIWIKQAMRLAIANKSRTVRMPVQCISKMYKVEQARTDYMATTGKEPDDEELAALAGVAKSTVGLLKKAVTKVYSLNAMVNDDSEDTFEDMMNVEQDTTDYTGGNEQVTDILESHMDALSYREQYILRSTYGIGGRQISPALLAMEVGVPRSLLNKVTTRALRKLRTALESDGVYSSAAV